MWIHGIIIFFWASKALTKDSLVNEAVQELNPSSLIIHHDYCPLIWLQRLLVEPQLPVVLLSLNVVTPSISHLARGLHIVCASNVPFQPEQLQQFRGERSMFYISTTTTKATSRHVMESLMRECYKWRILHVIAWLAEDEDRFYYRYRAYPQFELQQYAIDRRPFFPTNFPNMEGQPLIVIPDQKNPRTIIYENWRTGQQILAGSVGRFVRTLAWKLNATIQYPMQIKPGTIIHASQLVALGEELQIDVPGGLIPITHTHQLPRSSYPFELSHICLMIPLAQPIPIRDIYLILGNAQHLLSALAIIYSFSFLLSLHRRFTEHSTNLVDFLLNDAALRGLLGQSFRHSLQIKFSGRWLYLLLGILGLNISSIHEAALGTLLTHPPKYFQPRTLIDVQRTQMPLIVDIEDMKSIDDIDQLPLDIIPVHVSEFNRQRDNMNMSNVYFASRLKWTLLSTQQKYFPRELFLYSMDACVSSLSLMVLQLPTSSWFLEPVNQLILDVRANGLYQHWVEMHFYDMAAANLISFSDPLERPHLRMGRTLAVRDLQWIWSAYGCLLIIASIVFMLEVIIKYMSNLRSKLILNPVNHINLNTNVFA